MARGHGRILSSIWEDEDFLALGVGPQRLYCFLLSQKNLNHAGLIPITARRWAKKAKGLTPASIERDLDALEAAPGRFIVLDEDGEELLIRTFVRNDGVYKQPHVMGSMVNSALEMTSPRLRAALLAEMDRIPLDELSDEPTKQGGPSNRAKVAEHIMALRRAFAALGTLPAPPAATPSATPSEAPSEAPSAGSSGASSAGSSGASSAGGSGAPSAAPSAGLPGVLAEPLSQAPTEGAAGGPLEGAEEGLQEPPSQGAPQEGPEPPAEGAPEGAPAPPPEGAPQGATEPPPQGAVEGAPVPPPEGATEGVPEPPAEGVPEGPYTRAHTRAHTGVPAPAHARSGVRVSPSPLPPPTPNPQPPAPPVFDATSPGAVDKSGRAGGVASAFDDQARALLAALEPARLRPHRGALDRVVPEVTALLADGWPAEELAAHMTADAPEDIRNLAGYLTQRLPAPGPYRPPGRRPAANKPGRCPVHQIELSEAGLCRGCAVDARVPDVTDAELDQRPPLVDRRRSSVFGSAILDATGPIDLATSNPAATQEQLTAEYATAHELLMAVKPEERDELMAAALDHLHDTGYNDPAIPMITIVAAEIYNRPGYESAHLDELNPEYASASANKTTPEGTS